MKAICWTGWRRLRNFPWSYGLPGSPAWAIKDRIVESLSTEAPLTKRAPRFPQELCLVEGRLTTIQRRTKTSGPNRQVKELPVCVSARAYFAKPVL